jgi:hypothetical protein
MKTILTTLPVLILVGGAIAYVRPSMIPGVKQWINRQREEDILKHWDTIYQEKLKKLDERLKFHRDKLYELRVEAKKAELTLEKLQEKQKRWDEILREFADQLKSNPGQVVFRGKTYTPEQAQKQFQSFLADMVTLKKEISSQEEQIKLRQEMVQEYEQAVAKLEQESNALKQKASQLLLAKKVADLKAEAQVLDQAIRGIHQGTATSEYQDIADLIKLLEGDLLDKIARTEVDQETPKLESLEELGERAADDMQAEIKSLEEFYLQSDASEVEKLKEQYLSPTAP